ncbi:MAG: aminopeptidase [Bacillota bacterium]
MIDSRHSKMAKVLVEYSLSIKKGDYFIISGNDISIPLIREVYKEALLKGALPEVLVMDEQLLELKLKYGNEEQLGFTSPVYSHIMENCDAFLRIGGSYHTKSLQNYDSSKISLMEVANKKASKIMQQRAFEGKMRWCITQYPTHAGAMEADMSLAEFEEFVYSACFVDKDDPIQEWLNLKEEQQKIIDYISKKNHIRVVADGTDLTLRVGGRTWVNSCGTTNFPSGEVYTGPIEDSLNGHIRYTFPAIKSGKVVEDVQLTFENGKVVKASAKSGEDLLHTMINLDAGSCYAGEFAIGTNYGVQKFTKNILFDEKIGGTIHIALGSAYPATGSKNQSSLHWDMICDMRNGGEIYADGELFYRDGKALI